MTKISKSGIAPQLQIKSEHLTRIIDALRGETPNTQIEVSGSVTASYFVGDGSQLTNLPIPSGSAGNQDNVDIIKTMTYTSTGQSQRYSVSSFINNLPNFPVSETGSLWFKITPDLSSDFGVNSSFLTQKYKILNKGKGTYGISGSIQVSEEDCELVYVNQLLLSDINDLASTDNIVISSLGEMSISEYVNQHEPAYDIQSQLEGYTIFRITDSDEDYLYLGEGGSFGQGSGQTTNVDFQLLNSEPVNGLQPVLEKVTEGDNTGYRIFGYDPTKYAPIGNNSIDLSFVLSDAPDNDYGVSSPNGISLGTNNKVQNSNGGVAIGNGNLLNGTYTTFAIGGSNEVGGFFGNGAMGAYNKVIQGYTSWAIGAYNEINSYSGNGFNFTAGMNNKVSSIASHAIGTALISKTFGTFVVGTANTDYLDEGGAEPVFVVGNGSVSTPSGPWEAIDRSDALVIRKSGAVEAPSQTISQIDEDLTGKALVTKEWAQAQGGGGSIPSWDQTLAVDSNITNKEIQGINSTIYFIYGGYRFGIDGNGIRLGNVATRSTYVGLGVMQSNPTGANNVVIGDNSSRFSEGGQENTIVGVYSNQSGNGSYNTLLGHAAGYNLTTGASNIVIGYQNVNSGGGSGLGLTTGNNNIIISPLTYNGITTGSGNVVIGRAGSLPSNSTNTIVLSDGVGNISLIKDNNGLVRLPEVTNSLIDNNTDGKAVVTKEWVKAQGGGSLPYKSFVALMNQTAPSALNLTVLENNIGSITATTSSTGLYNFIGTGLFPENKTVIITQNIRGQLIFQAYRSSDDVVGFSSNNRNTLAYEDANFSNHAIEIRVYN